MHIDRLPEKTRDVFISLKNDPDISEFVLIGGTAISLHCAHRKSEDLDFAYAGIRLPCAAIKRIIQRLDKHGFKIAHATDEATTLYWENEGEDIETYQQDWAVNDVKVTFFALGTQEQNSLPKNHVTTNIGSIKILDMDGLFEMKSRLLTKRTASRDIFDLWHFLENEDRIMEDIIAFAKKEDKYYTIDLIRHRLLPQVLPKPDPGFEPLNPNSPVDFETLKEKMGHIFGEYESRVARQITLDGIQ